MPRYVEVIEQTASVSELVSGGVFLGQPAPAFSGPAQVGKLALISTVATRC